MVSLLCLTTWLRLPVKQHELIDTEFESETNKKYENDDVNGSQSQNVQDKQTSGGLYVENVSKRSGFPSSC